jgi:hypothetical protein
MPVSRLVAMLLPTLDVRVSELLHERCQITVAFWPKDKVPMVSEQAIRANPHRSNAQRFLHHPLERQDIFMLPEEVSPSDSAI